MTSDDFHDRVVLITGGSSGMGLATARLLLERGAQVIITGRDKGRLERAADQLAAGPRLLAVQADAADLGDLDRWRPSSRKIMDAWMEFSRTPGLGCFSRPHR